MKHIKRSCCTQMYADCQVVKSLSVLWICKKETNYWKTTSPNSWLMSFQCKRPNSWTHSLNNENNEEMDRTPRSEQPARSKLELEKCQRGSFNNFHCSWNSLIALCLHINTLSMLKCLGGKFKFYRCWRIVYFSRKSGVLDLQISSLWTFSTCVEMMGSFSFKLIQCQQKPLHPQRGHSFFIEGKVSLGTQHSSVAKRQERRR